MSTQFAKQNVQLRTNCQISTAEIAQLPQKLQAKHLHWNCAGILATGGNPVHRIRFDTKQHFVGTNHGLMKPLYPPTFPLWVSIPPIAGTGFQQATGTAPGIPYSPHRPPPVEGRLLLQGCPRISTSSLHRCVLLASWHMSHAHCIWEFQGFRSQNIEPGLIPLHASWGSGDP